MTCRDRRRYVSLWGVLAFAGCAASGTGRSGAPPASPSPGTTRPELAAAAPVADSARVFSGADAFRLTQIKLQDGTYLMRITGSESPIEGRVLPYRRHDEGGERQVFITELNGREFWVLHRSSRWGSVSYEVYVPYDRLRHGVQVGLDEKASATVDAAQLVEAYRKALADGSLEQLRQFKRAQEEEGVRAQIEKTLAELNRTCGSTIALEVDWKTIDDPTLKRLSIASYCGGPSEALEQLCKSARVRNLVAARLRRIRCSFGAERAIALQGDTIAWQVAEGATNLAEYARTYLAESAPWGAKKTPAELTYEENTAICSDGKSVFVGHHPHRDPKRAEGDYAKQIFFGDGERFTRVPHAQYLGEGWFFDPRFFSPTHNENVRGIDYRYHSRFTIDAKTRKCQVICADRKLDLDLLPAARVSAILEAARFSETNEGRLPYGLARDRRGIYYYVDRGSAPGARDYRLYRGPTGKLRLMKMTNIVSDSRGDVFATRSGSLRFVLEPAEAFWVEGSRRAKLIPVPTRENLQLIYNELGIYLGQPFGTPCDLL